MKTNFKIDNTMVEMKMEGSAHNMIEGKEFTKKDIINHINNSLKNANIDGTLSPQLVISGDINTGEVTCVGTYVFLNVDSKDVIETTVKIPVEFEGFVSQPKRYKPSERLIEVMSKFCDPVGSKTIRTHKLRNGKDVVYFRCDIDKVLCELV